VVFEVLAASIGGVLPSGLRLQVVPLKFTDVSEEPTMSVSKVEGQVFQTR
jgi:hypothetical protein